MLTTIIVKYINKNYLKFLASFICLAQNSFTATLEEFRSLGPSHIHAYLAPEYESNRQCLELARMIAERIYETPPRDAASFEFGHAFNTCAEATAHLLENVRDKIHDKTVVSLGGNAGEEMIWVALAGAKRVVNNDISDAAIAQFNTLKAMAPAALQEKIEAAHCNCFELLTSKPDLQGQCDFVICNNLIHFFTEE